MGDVSSSLCGCKDIVLLRFYILYILFNIVFDLMCGSCLPCNLICSLYVVCCILHTNATSNIYNLVCYDAVRDVIIQAVIRSNTHESILVL